MTKSGTITYTGDSKEAGSTCYHCQERKTFPENSAVRIRVAIFFDGTLNNRTNTWLGEKGTIKGVSYKNSLTNIAIMEMYYEHNLDYDYCFSVYVEGIGTIDEETDKTIASALGQGTTGILNKVERGISKIMGGINRLLDTDDIMECLHLDCFGFSRGAAAARNFIYSALLGREDRLKLRLQSSGYCVGDIKVKFVGLYDTVASYGINHSNDTIQLNLDAIRHAEEVVQLAAAEEHRKNFPLTNINSAPHGLQLFLPGAHSDIGGGYVENMDEVDHQIMFVFRKNGLNSTDKAALAREREWLLASGWYREDEIHKEDLWNEVKVTRRGIRHHFHRIPLRMMIEFATIKGVNFLPELLIKYSTPPELYEAEMFIRESPQYSPDYWFNLKTQLIKSLRHDYLHFSACFGSILGCNQPQFTDNNEILGRREREVLDG